MNLGSIKFNNLRAMEVRGLLKGLVGIIMIACFLYQMKDLFDQYLNDLKTVAVSFRENNTVEIPSFAFCDSTAFRKRIGVTANKSLYNDTAFNTDDVSIVNDPNSPGELRDTFTVQSFPTTDNGNCTLYEFHGEYHVNIVVGKFKISVEHNY